MSDSVDNPLDPNDPNLPTLPLGRAAKAARENSNPPPGTSKNPAKKKLPLPTTKPSRRPPPTKQSKSGPPPRSNQPIVLPKGYRPPVDQVPEWESAEASSEESSWIRKVSGRKSSSLIFSLGFHLVLFVSMALWIISLKQEKVQTIRIAADLNDTPTLDTTPLSEIAIKQSQKPTPNKAQVDQRDKEIDILTEPIAAEQSEQQTADLQNPIHLQTAPIQIPLEGMTMPIGGGIDGRSKSMRSALAGGSEGSGSEASEEAVEEGLKWLSLHQFENGAWRFNHRTAPKCDGRCRNTGSHGATTGATGLAIMSFLGAGYTHRVGPYQKEVGRGLEYLVSRVRKSRYGGNLSEGTMYAHAIATIALCEAYAMTGDQKLIGPGKLAVEYIIHAQHSGGGWRYTPGQPGDITVTAWQIMALKSAEMAGIKVSGETWIRSKKFLDSVQNQSGYFGYEGPEEDNTPCTAFGMLARMHTGWHREHDMFAPGHSMLNKAGPSKSDMYFNYYATQVMFHYRNSKSWPKWNQAMRDYLVKTQSQKGHQKGSWYFKNKYGDQGGRLFNTCMAIMTLEVYYRYLPLYDSNRFGPE